MCKSVKAKKRMRKMDVDNSRKWLFLSFYNTPKKTNPQYTT